MKSARPSGALVAAACLLGAAALTIVLVTRKHGDGKQVRGDCQGAAACEAACAGGSGDACACGTLGTLLLHGTSIARDAHRALGLLEDSCDKGCPTACWALGTAYGSGAGLRASSDKAARYFEKMNRICGPACDDGDADRCFTLAASYVNGRGVQPDPARAKELYTRAASLYGPACEGGEAHACARLALQIDHGLGIEQSKPKSTATYEKACALGDGESCEEAAKRYDGRSKDLPRDDARAADLARKACAAGRAMGCAIANDGPAFMKIVAAACEAGSAFDCGSAAFALTHGVHGVDKDQAAAVGFASKRVDLEQKACVDEDGSACLALVRPFESGSVEGEPEGTVIPRDLQRAETLRKRACDLGYQPACGAQQTPGGPPPPGVPPPPGR